MRTWRGRLFMTIVVYFAGFATAIYTLAPAADDGSSPRTDAGSESQGFSRAKVMAAAERVENDVKKYAVIAKEKGAVLKSFIESQLAEENEDS